VHRNWGIPNFALAYVSPVLSDCMHCSTRWASVKTNYAAI
jgi:hypothetical protein